jgi:enoyl-CoA hydratase
MAWHKKMKLSFGDQQSIKSINANYKDGENGFETRNKIFRKCFGTEILKKEQPFRERKAVFTGE